MDEELQINRFRTGLEFRIPNLSNKTSLCFIAKFIVYVLTCLAEVAMRNEAQNNTTRTEDSSVVRSEEEPESDVLEMSDKNDNVGLAFF